MNSVNVRCIKFTILIIGIITILFGLYRCFLGADISDEILYISDPFFVANGATPYVNNWLQTPGFSFFMAPVVKLYELFVPTHQGIFLFMRLFFLVGKCLIYIGICILFRNTSYKYVTMLVALLLVPNFFGMLPAFNYTNIPLMGLSLAGILLLYQWYAQTERNIRFLPFINGIILACVTLCSPTQIANCLVIMIFYFFCISKKACRQYIAGGFATAVLFTLYMTVKAGSISGLIYSLEVFLQQPYFLYFGPSTLTWQAYNILPLAIEEIIPYVICVLFFEIVRRFVIKKYALVWSCKNGLVLGAFCGLIISLLRYAQYPLLNRMIILLSIGSFFFRFISGSKGVNKLFDFVAIPEMVTFFGMALTVYGGVANRFYVFIPMALICLIYIYDTLKEQIGDKCFYASAAYVLLFLLVICKYEIQTVYGEFADGGTFASVSTLTTQVEKGIYSGVYTSEEKAAVLQELEMHIRSNTSADEYVLFLDCAPMAYLMTDAHFCAPTSWDPVLYTAGNKTDITMLEEYFAIVDQTPDKIIYIQTEKDRPLSIEQEDYEFSQYVMQNYSLDNESVIEDMYRVLIYNKN